MNWRALWRLTEITWAIWFQQRSFFFLLAFGWMFPPLVSLFIWSTAASGRTISGMARGEFVAYYLLLILVNQLTYSMTNWTVGDAIREGTMSFLLLRPLSPIASTFATEMAGKAVFMLFVIPVAIVLALFLHPILHPTLLNSLAFGPVLLLAWLLRFFWGYWFALLAFWTTRADALLAIQDTLIFLLAGQVAPVALLPGPLKFAATVLPFRYMVGFPVEVLSGHLSPTDLLNGLLSQVCWLLVAFCLFSILWRRGLRRYAAVGG